jgi:hypothetical protein
VIFMEHATSVSGGDPKMLGEKFSKSTKQAYI